MSCSTNCKHPDIIIVIEGGEISSIHPCKEEYAELTYSIIDLDLMKISEKAIDIDIDYDYVNEPKQLEDFIDKTLEELRN